MNQFDLDLLQEIVADGLFEACFGRFDYELIDPSIIVDSHGIRWIIGKRDGILSKRKCPYIGGSHV